MTPPAPHLNCQTPTAADPTTASVLPAFTGPPLPHDLVQGRNTTIVIIDTGASAPGVTGDRESCILHGTAVASAARATAPAAKIHSLRHSDRVDVVEGTVDGLIAAIHRAKALPTRHKIVNISMVTCEDSPPLRTAVESLLDTGVIVVASIGNSGQCDPGKPTYPAATPGVIAVGAVEEIAVLGNSGETKDPKAQSPAAVNLGRTPAPYGIEGIPSTLHAPGGPVHAQLQRGRPDSKDVSLIAGAPDPFVGTSFATPIVAGTATLVWEADPTLSAKDVTKILVESAIPAGGVSGEPTHLASVVSPRAAVTAARDAHRSQQPNTTVAGQHQDSNGDPATSPSGNTQITAAVTQPVTPDYSVAFGLSAIVSVVLVVGLIARAFASDKTPPSGSERTTRQGT